MNFEAFYILTADVDNKFDVGLEVFSRSEVGDGFNNAIVHIKSVLYDFFAVACNGRACYVNVGADFINSFKKAFDQLNRISL